MRREIAHVEPGRIVVEARVHVANDDNTLVIEMARLSPIGRRGVIAGHDDECPHQAHGSCAGTARCASGLIQERSGTLRHEVVGLAAAHGDTSRILGEALHLRQ